MNKLSPAQQNFLDFFSKVETPIIHRQLKDVFRVAAFESDIAIQEGGKNALFTLWYIIELIEPLINDAIDCKESNGE